MILPKFTLLGLALVEWLKAFEIVFGPAGLLFNHAAKSLGNEDSSRAMVRHRYPSPIGMLISAVAATLRFKEKSFRKKVLAPFLVR